MDKRIPRNPQNLCTLKFSARTVLLFGASMKSFKKTNLLMLCMSELKEVIL